MSRKVLILLGLAILCVGGLLLLRYSSVGAVLFSGMSGEGTWLFPLVAVSALLDSINPARSRYFSLPSRFSLVWKPRKEVLLLGGSLSPTVHRVLSSTGIPKALHLRRPAFYGALYAAAVIIFVFQSLGVFPRR